ncbi:MAG: ATP-binding protein [Bacteroidia bacterium]
MNKILPLLCFVFLSFVCRAQLDSGIESRNIEWHKKNYNLIMQHPTEEVLIDFLGNLNQHLINSTISLKNLRFYFHELDDFFSHHPEFNRTRYLLEYGKAVLEMYLDHPDEFYQIINRIESELKEKKYYKELFHLNLMICHFLPSINKLKEAKIHFYENEKLLSDLKQAGIKDFSGFELVQHTNSFAYFYKVQGNLDSAEKYFTIGLERAREKKDSIWIGIISGNLGSILYLNGHYKEAEALLIKDKDESLKGKQTTSAINALLNLVDIKLAEPNLKVAEMYLNQASQLIDGLQLDDPDLLNYYYVERLNRKGHFYMLKGDKKNSAKCYELAFNKLKDLYRDKTSIMGNLNNRRYAFEENVHKISELEENSKQRQIITGFILLVLLSLLILVIIQRRFNLKLRAQKLQIEQQAKVLHDLNIQKSKLFSIVAHDMRSPFANLRNLIDLHKDNSLSDQEFLKFCAEINQSIHGLSGTFENIMSWAKVGMEEGIITKIEAVQIPQIFQEIEDQMLPLLLTKSIQLDILISSEKKLLADSNFLLVVIRNLVHNAIKFSHQNSKIYLQYTLDESNEQRALIKVKDHGIGIDDKLMSKLFEVNNTNKSLNGTSGERGSGLGLVICQEFVQAMSGTLHVESKPGEGSTFIISLPILN